MKVPYPLTAAMPFDQRCAQMAHAIAVANARNYPRLTRTPIDEHKSLIIACYGPSLASTWETIRDQQAAGKAILSMSGATRFLADRGVTADYHVDMDPRAHKVKHLDPPIPGVHYLMASVCPPETWEILCGQRVTLWHTHCGRSADGTIDTYDWVKAHDPQDPEVIHGGSTIGLSSIHIGGLLGYRHFEIHGMDGSLANNQRHAGPHFGHPQNDGHTWNAEGRTYQTSRIMANAVAETINTCRNFPIFAVFHGDGLTQALIREANLVNCCTANQTDKAAKVRNYYAKIVEMPTVGDRSFVNGYWDGLIEACPKSDLLDLIAIITAAEPRRAQARYNTGSVPLETALQLRAACRYYRPRVVAEVGTFIGTSTLALLATDALYTCDRDNDCLPPSGNIHLHPYQSSTQMLQRLFDDGYSNQVDLFFFDGRIADADLHLIEALSHPKTVYFFDDCTDKSSTNKGTVNIKKLAPIVPDHVPVAPNLNFVGRSTLGALLPTLPRIHSDVAA